MKPTRACGPALQRLGPGWRAQGDGEGSAEPGLMEAESYTIRGTHFKTNDRKLQTYNKVQSLGRGLNLMLC